MREVASAERVSELIDALASSLGDRIAAGGDAPWAVVGIKRRGDLLAQRLADRVPGDPFRGRGRGRGRGQVPGRVGSIDVTLYRDDLSEIAVQPVVKTSDIAFDIDGVNLVLVDDVLMTGRSVRAALQSLMDFGRPRRVWLAVLVDRGGRELPICPDFVALDLAANGDAVASGDVVHVRLRPLDEQDGITVDLATGQRKG